MWLAFVVMFAWFGGLCMGEGGLGMPLGTLFAFTLFFVVLVMSLFSSRDRRNTNDREQRLEALLRRSHHYDETSINHDWTTCEICAELLDEKGRHPCTCVRGRHTPGCPHHTVPSSYRR